MMERSFSEALKQRRTYYSITNQSPISDQEIECIVNMTVRHVPSAFNSQTTRVVLLLGESHKKLWQIVKDTLKKIVPAEAFAKTEEKIDHSFACGYGTVLFFEDQKVVKGLQEAFPSYQENFPGWSLQTSAMHQLAIWVMLEDVGFGASLHCKIINRETNVLLLDEPTNHLDADAKDALKKSLQEYRGTLLLICHEPEFYQDVVNEVWDCSKWTTRIV